ncbi:MAG: prefoldin subunit alpha [Candidatus Lokiarchaeota archaeon]|nr:prefoldin subunit alpha [Candidatus Lokiarchaeota archaeon]MBD3199934.1 prefoldin subunit alpha [Candidatus Lokiarchaeota archaeon]
MENQNQQTLAYQFQYLREQKDMYEQNLNFIDASLNNLINTKKTVENLQDIEEGEEILVPIGGMVNIKANIKQNNKVLLSVSDDVVIEKTLEGSSEFLEQLIEQHREQKKFLNEQLQKIEVNLQGISQYFQRSMGQQPPQQ